MSSSEAINKYFMSNKTLASKEHALFCAGIAHVYMGIAFYANYLSRQVTRRMLADVLTIEKTVQKALRGHLGASPWFATIPEPMLTDAALVNSLRLLEAPNATVLDDMYGAFPDMSENVFDNVRHAAEAHTKTTADISMAEFVTNGTAHFFFHSTHEQFQLLPEILEEPFYELEYLEAVKVRNPGVAVASGRRKCNGPLTLVEDFARAFGCKQGDPMYSGHNCALAR
ncbi:hypothetical protein MRX96_041829 [Rhipicephalus microplus]